MIWLTRREQRAVAWVVALLLVGWAAKTWRDHQPPQTTQIPAAAEP